MGEKTVITSDVLVPEAEFVTEYTSHNPSKLLGVMPLLIKEVWRVSSSNAYTDKIKWDVTGEKIDMYGEFRCRDKKDQRTTVWTRIIVMGQQDAKTKEGTVQVKVKPKINVEIESATPLDKALRMLYLNMFYKDQYKKYVEIAKRRVNEFDEQVRRVLELEEREAGSRPASRM